MARTTREGDHDDVYGLNDDGGRVFLELKPPLAIGRHKLAFEVQGDHSLAESAITMVSPATDTVVFDIDGTLTTSDGELLKQIEALGHQGVYTPEAWPKANAVALRYAEGGYLVVYVTGRPDNLRTVTRDWLIAKGFPAGPVLFTDHLHEAVPGAAVAGFKARALARLKKEGKLNLVVAYGNAETDIDAYLGAGLPASSVYMLGPHGGKRATVAITYAEHLKSLSKLPRAKVPAPPGAW